MPEVCIDPWLCVSDTVTEGLLSALMNWQSAEYTAVTCTRCSFTEFYRCKLDQIDKIADLIFGR